MTDATWDDFVSSPELIDAATVPAVVEVIAEALVGEETWAEWTAAADADVAADDSTGGFTGTEAIGDDATGQMDANLALATDLVDQGDLSGAYDAISATQGFNDVAGDAYGSTYDTSYDSGFDAGY